MRGFKEWWEQYDVNLPFPTNNAGLRAWCELAFTAGLEHAATIADQMDAPQSIGQDHGRHHRAGIQRVAEAIRAER